jgi:hypothetical protein
MPKVTHIEIEHIGPSDKPIFRLIITAERNFVVKDTDDFPNLIVTDKKSFQTIVSYMQENNSNSKDIDDSKLELGSFRVSMYDHDLPVTSYILKSHDISRKYFAGLMSVLKENGSDKRLIDAIDVLKVRIDYP